jgi:hypothetical protein
VRRRREGPSPRDTPRARPLLRRPWWYSGGSSISYGIVSEVFSEDSSARRKAAPNQQRLWLLVKKETSQWLPFLSSVSCSRSAGRGCHIVAGNTSLATSAAAPVIWCVTNISDTPVVPPTLIIVTNTRMQFHCDCM